ncbi:MAG: hydantoinase/carbamoylase family amidase [Alphaproteobacteria bacterium]
MVEPDIALAERLFDDLERNTKVGRGICRATYGEGEQYAHDLIRQTGESLGLASAVDSAGNLFLTLAGDSPDLPAMVVGSHLDSVPDGGNYDGAAGVIAGLVIAAGFIQAGRRPPRSLIVAGLRGEESAWFEGPYIGSRTALGLFPAAALDTDRRSDTRRTLADHMAAAGFDPDGVRAGKAYLTRDTVAGYVELHIEQGPILEAAAIPVGIVTAINGCLRYTDPCCFGLYGHSGVQPRELRHDAVHAVIDLGARFYGCWDEMLAAGHEVRLSMGVLGTDPAAASPSKVAGECRFSLDVRTPSLDTMKEMERRIAGWTREIADARGVRFDRLVGSYSFPAPMDSALRDGLQAAADALDVSTMSLSSGAGHDAAVFAQAGIPSAMVFVRNAHGSHNPDEAMAIEDFAAGVRVMAHALDNGLAAMA